MSLSIKCSNRSSYLIRLMRKLNELIYIKCLAQCLVHSKYSINGRFSSCHDNHPCGHLTRVLAKSLTLSLVSSFSARVSKDKILLSKIVKNYSLNAKEHRISATIHIKFGIYLLFQKITQSPTNSKFLKHIFNKFLCVWANG